MGSVVDWIACLTGDLAPGSIVVSQIVIQCSDGDSNSILVQVYPSNGTAAGDADLAMAVVRELFADLRSALSELHQPQPASSAAVDNSVPSAQQEEAESYFPGSSPATW